MRKLFLFDLQMLCFLLEIKFDSFGFVTTISYLNWIVLDYFLEVLKLRENLIWSALNNIFLKNKIYNFKNRYKSTELIDNDFRSYIF